MQAQGMPIAGSLNDDAQRAALQSFVRYAANNGMTSLGVSALTVEFAWVIQADIEDLIAVLSGHEGDGVYNPLQTLARGKGLVPQPSDMGPFNTFYDLDSTGFNDIYRDPDTHNNQVHHTWYYVQLAYYNADLTAQAGNWYHENVPWESGRSQQDYIAGRWGIVVGHGFQGASLTLIDLANKLRTDLGDR